MLAFVAASVLYPADKIRAEIDHGDAKYAQLYPYPAQPPGDHLNETLQVYRDIVTEHGPIPSAEAGIGRCLMLFGRFQEAAKAFQLAGVRYKAKREEASEYARVAQAISRQTKPVMVQQLVRVSGINRWVAFLTGPTTDEGWQVEHVPNMLAVFKRVQGRLEKVGKAQDVGGFWGGEFTTLYLARLCRSDQKWRILFFRQGMADCSPFDVRILSVVPTGLRIMDSLDTCQGAWVQGPSAKHNLLVMAGLVWHVQWQDLYEWNRGRFRLANRLFPEFFNVNNHPEPAYNDWMDRAAELDIHGRFREGKIAWQKALHACRMAIWHQSYGYTDPFYASKLYGDEQENLGRIARRISWLDRHEYGHVLLYRPISNGLEVHPARD